MSLNLKIEEAIQTAVQETSQNESLSRGLIAWFDAVSSGNEEFDKESTGRRLEHIYDDTTLPRDDDGAKTDKDLDEWTRKVLKDFDLGSEEDVRPNDSGLSDGSRSDA